MTCTHCRREIPEESSYCQACGAPQREASGGWQPRRLTRPRTGRRVAGVCAGLAEYLGVDVTFVRAAWVILSIVPGAILGGVLAYLLAWLIIPDGAFEAAEPATSRVLTRSRTDRRIAGVCGGLAEYFQVDPTPIRLLWIILSVVPGAIAGGLIAYALAWILMPNAPAALAPKPRPA